jgi:hypothetical protein
MNVRFVIDQLVVAGLPPGSVDPQSVEAALRVSLSRFLTARALSASAGAPAGQHMNRLTMSLNLPAEVRSTALGTTLGQALGETAWIHAGVRK